MLRRPASGGVVTTALTLTGVYARGRARPSRHRLRSGLPALTRHALGLSLLHAERQCTGAGGGECNVVVRYKESAGTLSGPEELLEIPTIATNHNGGTLRFAPDKTLFISVGDNDTDEEPNPLSRDLSDLRGKILRINRDGSVPIDNPFVGQAGRRPEIWVWGLRNPFRFSIDPASGGTGTLWIGDVGEHEWEEVDRGVKGADYGYPCFEGNDTFQFCSAPGALPPVFAYGHDGHAVHGGDDHRRPGLPRNRLPGVVSGPLVLRRLSARGGSAARRSVPAAARSRTFSSSRTPREAPSISSRRRTAASDTSDINGGGVHEICGVSDADGDGFASPADCNDLDASVYPGAPELCDGKNNDCAGGTDDATCEAFSGDDGIVDGRDLSLLGRFFGALLRTPPNRRSGPTSSLRTTAASTGSTSRS